MSFSHKVFRAIALSNIKVFVDMDGVLADFEGGFLNQFGAAANSHDDEMKWGMIHSVPDFFRRLQPIPGAFDFFDRIRCLDPIILTSCPHTNYMEIAKQKRAMIRECFSDTVLVLPCRGSENKPAFMNSLGDILIDDWKHNIVDWNAAGGVAIKHVGVDFEATLVKLNLALVERLLS